MNTRTGIDQFGPHFVAARQEIQQRILQFGRGVDRLDLDLIRDSFHPDAEDDHGPYKGDVEGLIQWISERHQTIRYSCHHIPNIFIEFANKIEAFAETTSLVWQSVTPEAKVLDLANADPSGEFEMLVSGRYVDHFTHRDGAWRIQRRVTLAESMMVIPGKPQAPGPESGFRSPTRDENDPAQQLRARLGLGSNATKLNRT
ncbi:nuclear transport factor 2 family protein [Rhodococcus sp. NPDC056960]|uniref:nuclear transport factor 2 family protein n=1 Tax=Rhodococcus TaxID=1827 RepID=UPI00362F2755